MPENNKSIAGLIILLALLAVGAVLYTVFLWFPYGGWIFDTITDLDFGISTKSLGGLLLVILLGIVYIVLTVILFLLPYIAFCALVIILWSRRRKDLK